MLYRGEDCIDISLERQEDRIVSLFFLLYDVFYDCAMSSFFWDNLFEHHHRVIIASNFFNCFITYFKEKPRRIVLIELYRYWNNRLLWLYF